MSDDVTFAVAGLVTLAAFYGGILFERHLRHRAARDRAHPVPDGMVLLEAPTVALVSADPPTAAPIRSIRERRRLEADIREVIEAKIDAWSSSLLPDVDADEYYGVTVFLERLIGEYRSAPNSMALMWRAQDARYHYRRLLEPPSQVTS